MIHRGITIVDQNLKPLNITGTGGYYGKQLMDKIVNWAEHNKTKIVSVVRLVHPGEASAFGVDGVIKIGSPAVGTMNWGIWKVYGSVETLTKGNPRGRHRYLDWKKETEEAAEELAKKQKKNPRKKEMKMGIPDKKTSLFKIMDEIDETPNEYRFRMQSPSKFHEESLKYGKKAITRGVRAIYGCPSGYWKASDIAKEGKCRKGMVMQSLRLSKDIFHSKTEAAGWIAKHTKPRRE